MAQDESTPETATPKVPPTEGGRSALGPIVAAQLIFAFILFVSINFLAASHHRAWDLSQNKDFSLSSQTRQLLASGLLHDREEPVRLIAVVRKSSLHHVRLRAVLEEYERLAKGMLTVEFVDPIRDTDSALEIATKYETTFINDVVIVDAVPAPLDSSNSENPGETENRAREVAALRKSHIRYVAVEDMLVFAADQRQERRLIGYQDEDQLTSAIRRAVEGAPRRFYFLADKSQVAGSEEDAPWEFLTRNFENLNINLLPIHISGLDRIPDDAAGVALVAPRYDFNEAEIAVFREYWSRPRSAVFVVLDPSLRQQPANLQAFLREHGVTPRPYRLFTMQGNKQVYDVAASFTNAPAVGDLGNATTLFEGGSSTLEIRENAEDLDLRRIEPYPLIKALDRYAAQPLDGSDAVPGPHYLGASISRGNERSDQGADETSRMVIIANSDFLQPRERYKEHIDFLRNTTNWLIGREELMGIGPKPVKHYKLLLPKSKVSFANQLNVFFVPGAFLLLAVFVWNTRRA